MEFINPYLTTKEKIELLQKWILVHSEIYYMLNSSIVDDFMFDSNARQLVSLQDDKQSFDRSRYSYVFYDFTGITGYHLHDRLNPQDKENIWHIATHILDLWGGKNDAHQQGKKKRTR